MLTFNQIVDISNSLWRLADDYIRQNLDDSTLCDMCKRNVTANIEALIGCVESSPELTKDAIARLGEGWKSDFEFQISGIRNLKPLK